jgi:hypothetical protein
VDDTKETISIMMHIKLIFLVIKFLWHCCCTLIPKKKNSYIIEGRVCYLTLCDRSYPKKLAFQYLEDLKNEFERVNGSQIETAARPYAFIKFGMILCSCVVIFLYTLS